MKTRPCAKINLGLNIVSKREDGYHNLETVFFPVPIYDEIEIKEVPDSSSASRCTLTISGLPIEGDPEKNLVVRAYRLLEKLSPLPPVHINLIKNIPMQAGMGGGSADGAFTLTLLNEMFHLNIPTKELEEMAATLGADCVQDFVFYKKALKQNVAPQMVAEIALVKAQISNINIQEIL